jgi:hypothetical protein
MRFLEFDDDGKPTLIERSSDNLPAFYAILSHTWGADEDEVTYQDLKDGSAFYLQKRGFNKLKFCADRSKCDGLRYFWVDTCCINRANFTELSEAINSMFKWYRGAARCYVYLADVPNLDADPEATVELAFPLSRWFTRGWTLQELIAPSSVQFFSVGGQLIGDKISRAQQIHRITNIDIEALRGNISGFDVDKRISWAQNRRTKIEEDAAYCLLGIVDIHMSLIYGEGKEKALARLRRKALKATGPSSDDPQHAPLKYPHVVVEEPTPDDEEREDKRRMPAYRERLPREELQRYEPSQRSETDSSPQYPRRQIRAKREPRSREHSQRRDISRPTTERIPFTYFSYGTRANREALPSEDPDFWTRPAERSSPPYYSHRIRANWERLPPDEDPREYIESALRSAQRKSSPYYSPRKPPLLEDPQRYDLLY